MAQTLFVMGTAILGFLGAVHLIYTFFTNNFDPYDLSAKTAMQSTSMVLTKETTMWKAWVGFNASHSFGAIFLAGFYIPLSLGHFSVIEQSLWFTWLPSLIGITYLILAKKFWFNIPFFGIFAATACYVGAAFLVVTGNG